jgi:hypothetical protein
MSSYPAAALAVGMGSAPGRQVHRVGARADRPDIGRVVVGAECGDQSLQNPQIRITKRLQREYHLGYTPFFIRA